MKYAKENHHEQENIRNCLGVFVVAAAKTVEAKLAVPKYLIGQSVWPIKYLANASLRQHSLYSSVIHEVKILMCCCHFPCEAL